MCPVLPSPGRCAWIAVTACVLGWASSTSAAISVGALAVVGYNDTASDSSGTDSFALVATETLEAGEVVYVTNNGWSNTSRQFLGAGLGDGAGNGPENLVKLTVNSTIMAGSIISSADVANSAFTWTSSGDITMPFGSTGTFSNLDLKHEGTGGSSYGDEIYIFQASETNPLFNITKFIFAIDFGSQFDAENWHEPPESLRGGNLPDGTVSTNPVTGGADYITVDTISAVENGDPNDNTAVGLDNFGDFYNGTFGLDLSSEAFLTLQNTGGTKEEWLHLINDSSHWTSMGTVFDTPLNFSTVPEPSRAVLLLVGCLTGLLRRRRPICE